jgi:hypothetical protein
MLYELDRIVVFFSKSMQELFIMLFINLEKTIFKAIKTQLFKT